MDGGENKKHAFYATISHIGLGALASWISALLVINSPFSSQLANELWPPVLIAVVIAGLMRISMMTRLNVAPAIIYGYASIWAFLSTPGLLRADVLLSVTFKNAIVSIIFCTILGALTGYINASMVNWLCALRTSKAVLKDS